jgi:hypothetical protein
MKNDLSTEQLQQVVTVSLPLGVVLKLAEQEHPVAVAQAVPAAGVSAMPIGTKWQGGIYAGISIEDNRPVALVLLEGDESMDWEAAGKWAKERGGVLPSRIDQLVLFKNLKSEFKDAWYWSGETFAGHSDYAWFQPFTTGAQSYYGKGNDYRVRAVRRIPIQ